MDITVKCELENYGVNSQCTLFLMLCQILSEHAYCYQEPGKVMFQLERYNLKPPFVWIQVWKKCFHNVLQHL